MSVSAPIYRVLSSSDSDAVNGQTTFCIGCGNCAFLNPAFSIVKNDNGAFQATFAGKGDEKSTSEVCPFASSIDEDALGKGLFGDISNIKHDRYLGYYLHTYVGFVKTDGYRSRGSSGGFVSWLAATLLNEGVIDAVIHVKDGPDPKHMYTYQVSYTVQEIISGAKSKYYPVEMSHVLSYVHDHPGKYLFIGIPCFVKAMRLMMDRDPVIKERIRFCVGLVCGHLKSDFFAKAEAWEAGVSPSSMRRVDFRHKIPDSPASDYAVEIERTDDQDPVIRKVAELSTSNWGYGFFKYNACDFCDDVLAETADVVFGDAWLPGYVNDENGCNVIVIRDPDIQRVFQTHASELELTDSTPDEIYQSQSGGFRHRRNGLQYRLAVKKMRGEWTPTKRVKVSMEGVSKRRRRIYEMRTTLKNESFVAFREAVTADDFQAFRRHMDPLVKEYQRVQHSRTQQILGKITPKKFKQLIKRLLRM